MPSFVLEGLLFQRLAPKRLLKEVARAKCIGVAPAGRGVRPQQGVFGFRPHSVLHGIFCEILSVSQNIVTDLNNVMPFLVLEFENLLFQRLAPKRPLKEVARANCIGVAPSGRGCGHNKESSAFGHIQSSMESVVKYCQSHRTLLRI